MIQNNRLLSMSPKYLSKSSIFRRKWSEGQEVWIKKIKYAIRSQLSKEKPQLLKNINQISIFLEILRLKMLNQLIVRNRIRYLLKYCQKWSVLRKVRRIVRSKEGIFISLCMNARIFLNRKWSRDQKYLKSWKIFRARRVWRFLWLRNRKKYRMEWARKTSSSTYFLTRLCLINDSLRQNNGSKTTKRNINGGYWKESWKRTDFGSMNWQWKPLLLPSLRRKIPTKP